jgi:Bacteriocin-protection, YdeI or OmpD-Associated/Domain of unknown function (DUF1905)
MSWFTHEFEAPIERHGVGRSRKVWYNVVFLPDRLAIELPFERHPQLRIEGEIAEVPIKSAFIPAGGGRHYLIVSPDTLKSASLGLGQIVEVRFRVGDQAAIDIPDNLQRALSNDQLSNEAWNKLTPGRKRALAHHVNMAKTEGTRMRRVAAVLAAITGNAATEAIAADAARLARLLGQR